MSEANGFQGSVTDFLRTEVERKDSRNIFLWTIMGSGFAGLFFVGGLTYHILDSHRWGSMGEHDLHLLAALSLVLFGLPLSSRVLEILHPTAKSTSFGRLDAQFVDKWLLALGWPSSKRWSATIRTGAYLYLAIAAYKVGSDGPALVGFASWILIIAASLAVIFDLVLVCIPGKFLARIIHSIYQGFAAAVPSIRQDLQLDLLQTKPFHESAEVKNSESLKELMGRTWFVLTILTRGRWAVAASALGWVLWHDPSHRSFKFLLDAGAVALTTQLFLVVLLVGIDIYYDHTREWVTQIEALHFHGRVSDKASVQALELVEVARYHGFHENGHILDLLATLGLSITQPATDAKPSLVPVSPAFSPPLEGPAI